MLACDAVRQKLADAIVDFYQILLFSSINSTLIGDFLLNIITLLPFINILIHF